MNEKLISVKDNKATFVMDLKLSDNITKTKDGYLLCENSVFGRTGFQTYMGRELVNMGFGDDELVEVFRDEEDVFNKDSLSTFVGKPVTLGHPNVDVTVDNIGTLGKGTIIGMPKRVGDNVVGDIIITDKETIELVETKSIRELSLGYETRLVRDEDRVRQTEIYINHLALVEQGRAGTAMIVDAINEEVQKMDKEMLIDLISKNGSNTINIYFGDEKVVEETKDVETKVEDAIHKTIVEVENQTEYTYNDETHESTEVEVSKRKVKTKVVEDNKNQFYDNNKVEDEEENKKEKEKENEKPMTKDSLKALLGELTLEERKELLGLNDAKLETKESITDEMFSNVNKVNNNVEGEVKLNDYSTFTTDGITNAIQEEYDKFSFRKLNNGTKDLFDRENKLNDLKTRDGRDFIKKGGL